MVRMGQVWDRTVEFLGESLGKVLPIAILAIFIPTSISGSLAGLQPTAGYGLRMAIGVLGLAFAVLSLWAQLAIAALAVGLVRSPGAAAGVATARLLPAIGVYILLGLVLFVAMLPAVVLVAVSGIDLAAAQAGRVTVTSADSGYILAAGLYGLVAMLVLLFVGARLVPLTAIIVAERRGAGAIPYSIRMTRGLTWRLFGVILLYVVVAFVATMAVQTVFGTVLRLVDGGTGPVTVSGVVTAIAVAAVSTGFTVLAASFCAKVYAALASPRDGVQTS